MTKYLSKEVLGALFICRNAEEIHVYLVTCWRGTYSSVGMLKVHLQACPWECHSYANPMGNVPWDGTAHICISNGTQKYN